MKPKFYEIKLSIYVVNDSKALQIIVLFSSMVSSKCEKLLHSVTNHNITCKLLGFFSPLPQFSVHQLNVIYPDLHTVLCFSFLIILASAFKYLINYTFGY